MFVCSSDSCKCGTGAIDLHFKLHCLGKVFMSNLEFLSAALIAVSVKPCIVIVLDLFFQQAP